MHNEAVSRLPLARFSSSDDLLSAVEVPFPPEAYSQYGEIRSLNSVGLCDIQVEKDINN